jgi:hypothetical protein
VDHPDPVTAYGKHHVKMTIVRCSAERSPTWLGHGMLLIRYHDERLDEERLLALAGFHIVPSSELGRVSVVPLEACYPRQ